MQEQIFLMLDAGVLRQPGDQFMNSSRAMDWSSRDWRDVFEGMVGEPILPSDLISCVYRRPL